MEGEPDSTDWQFTCGDCGYTFEEGSLFPFVDVLRAIATICSGEMLILRSILACSRTGAKISTMIADMSSTTHAAGSQAAPIGNAP